MKFVDFLNEDIKINGKNVPDDTDEKDKAPDYTQDTNDDDQGDTNNTDDTTNDDNKTGDITINTNADNNTPADDTNDTEDPDAAPDYTQDTNDEPTEGEDTGTDDAPDYTQDTNDEPTNDNGDLGEGNGENEDPDASQDYTQDADGDEGDNNDVEGGEDDTETGPADNPDDTNPPDDTEASSTLDSEINQLQADLFANLSPRQIEIKIRVLKEQYITLYEDIIKVIDRLGKIDRIDDTIKPIEFVEKKLNELKDMVKDALTDSFGTRSYAENQVVLQRLIAIYTSLCKIIEGIAKNSEKEE